MKKLGAWFNILNMWKECNYINSVIIQDTGCTIEIELEWKGQRLRIPVQKIIPINGLSISNPWCVYPAR